MHPSTPHPASHASLSLSTSFPGGHFGTHTSLFFPTSCANDITSGTLLTPNPGILESWTWGLWGLSLALEQALESETPRVSPQGSLGLSLGPLCVLPSFLPSGSGRGRGGGCEAGRKGLWGR